MPSLLHQQIIRLEELLRICRVMAELGVTRLKISGGEPLVRKGAVDFIAQAKKLPGIQQVTVTTNGQLLAEYAESLQAAAIDGVNISLDSLDPARYQQITHGGKLESTLFGIERAVQIGIKPLKLNTVLLKGFNQDEIVPLVAWAAQKGILVRFIELMPVGLGSRYQGVSGKEVLQVLRQEFGVAQPVSRRLGNGPARYYAFAGLPIPVGLIDAVSHNFCQSCNRVRLTADGHLKLCLNFDWGCDLLTPLRQGCSDAELKLLIGDVIKQKPQRHRFGDALEHTETKNMNQIGG